MTASFLLRPAFKPLLAFAVLASGALAVPSAASADGFYISGFGGVDFRDDPEGLLSDDSPEVGLAFDNGSLFGGAIGYELDVPFGAFRIEGEFTRRRSDIGGLVLDDVAQTPIGDQNIIAGMGNIAFDIELPVVWIEPYIGGGAGVARVNTEIADALLTIDSTDTQLAYQVFGGVTFPIPSIFVGVELFVEGRYFEIPENDLEASLVTPVPLGVTFETDTQSTSVTGGLRLHF